MTLRDELYAGLREYDVRSIKIEKDYKQNGLDATRVDVRWNKPGDGIYVSTWTFAKKMGIGAEGMVDIMKSYLNSEHEGL